MVQSRTVKVIALSTGQGLTALVTLVAAAVLTRILSVRDYATYRQTLLAYHFAAPLLTLSLPTALYYFLPGETRRKRGVLFDNLILLTVMGIVFSLLLLAGGNRLLAWRFSNPAVARPLRWMAPYALFALPASAVGACLIVQNRVTQLSIFNVFTRLLTLLAVIASALIWRSPLAPLKTHVACAGVMLALALWMMVQAVPRDDVRVSLSGMFRMLKYSVPLGLASMLGLISLQLDKVIVASMCDPQAFAIYANGALEIPLIGIITGSIAAVILTDMRAAIANGDESESLRLFRIAAAKSATILLPTMCFLLLFGTDVVITLYSEKYRGSTAPFRLYLCILPARIIYYGPALMALGLTKVVFIRSLFELCLNAVLSILIVYLFGPLGAAVATLFTLYFWSIPFNLRFVSKGFRCHTVECIPLAAILRTTAASVLATLAALPLYWIDGIARPVRLVLGAGLFAVVYLGCSWLLGTELRHSITRGMTRVFAWAR